MPPSVKFPVPSGDFHLSGQREYFKRRMIALVESPPKARTMKTICWLFLVISIVYVRCTDEVTDYDAFICPSVTGKRCADGINVTCCQRSECHSGEVCCLVDEECTQKCLKPMKYGFAYQIDIKEKPLCEEIANSGTR
ncbi:hypothetical protein CDAR_578481 [Caerostris darwini]|uniref:WAP domain-containing protein n=1 Tax=Caerostris darwini TaxID=1538125 RepID=A0AAV4UC37_9ARAC|nr:hypothetical protein CDAR_578481 [Caerostris darwini]